VRGDAPELGSEHGSCGPGLQLWLNGPRPMKGHQEVSVRWCLCLRLLPQPPSVPQQPHQPSQNRAPWGPAEQETRLALSNASRAHVACLASAPCHGARGERLVLPGSTVGAALRALRADLRLPVLCTGAGLGPSTGSSSPGAINLSGRSRAGLQSLGQ